MNPRGENPHRLSKPAPYQARQSRHLFILLLLNNKMEIYNYVITGLVTKDLIIVDSFTKECFGGSVTYGSIQIKELGAEPFLVSYIGEKDYLDYVSLLDQYKIKYFLAKYEGNTLTFKNIYKNNIRTQNVYNYKFLPKISLEFPFGGKCLHLGPILNELDFSKIAEIRRKFNFIAIDLQGMYRKAFKNKINKQNWAKFKDFSKYFDIIKSSIEELYNVVNIERFLYEIMELKCIFILTLGEKGSLLMIKDELYFIPSFKPNRVVDPTGAGDVYLATFLYFNCLLNYEATESALYASCASSFVVEEFGYYGIVGENDILNRFREQNLSTKMIDFNKAKEIINDYLIQKGSI